MNVFRACVGLPAENFMQLEHKVSPILKLFSITSFCKFRLVIATDQIPSQIRRRARKDDDATIEQKMGDDRHAKKSK